MARTSKTRTVAAKKAKTAPTHPPIKKMVNQAISELATNKGLSFVAIKKYVSDNFEADINKLKPHIKKYLSKSVDDGSLVQLTGSGATGSFRFPLLKSKKQAAEKSDDVPMSTVARTRAEPVKPKAAKKSKTKPAAGKVVKAKAVKKAKAPKSKKGDENDKNKMN